MKLTDFRDRHEGETMYIIGGGLSLRGFKWELLRDRLTMTCNEHILHMPFVPTYYYQLDWNPLIDWIVQAVKHFPTIRFLDPQCCMHPDYIIVYRLAQDDDRLYCDRGLGYANYAIVLMTELALYMGCSSIVLLGVDLIKDRPYEYFWGAPAYEHAAPERMIDRQIEQYKRFQKLGDRVRVANKNSALVAQDILQYQEVK
jgi:hypothetical protein